MTGTNLVDVAKNARIEFENEHGRVELTGAYLWAVVALFLLVVV